MCCVCSVFEYLVRSDIVNCQNSQSDLMCVSYSQKAALWSLYGNRSVCSDSVLTGYQLTCQGWPWKVSMCLCGVVNFCLPKYH